MGFSLRPASSLPGVRATGVWECGRTSWLWAPLFTLMNKNFHVSALGAYELHSKKEDSDIRVGQMLTIEGGIGATTKKAMNFGMLYYAQWKITKDSGLGLPTLVEDRLGKNHNFGLGPEASMVIPLSKNLSKLAVLNFRYLFDVGTQLDTKGQSLLFSVTFKVH